MGVNRSSFYKWRSNAKNPCESKHRRELAKAAFMKYHKLYPTHGYRWLNAKIRLDTGEVYSDSYAHRCCKSCGIKSESRRLRGYKATNRVKVYPNLLLADMKIDAPMQVVVSDMTAFWAAGKYWELTLYMDLFNNEIVSHAISSRKGDRNTYIDGLKSLLEKKNGEYSGLKMILHSDQGAVYSSKDFNEILPAYSITRSMSRAGTPTDNGAMEAINGWAKEEMFADFNIGRSGDVPKAVREYVDFFNKERPSFALDYLTPAQYKERYWKPKLPAIVQNK